jgi:hypothetical protein
MAYLDQANLAIDEDFNARLGAALNSEAILRPAGDAFADMILRGGGVSWFMPLVSAAPGFADKYAAGGSASITDGEMLSAIQANWDRAQALAGVS